MGLIPPSAGRVVLDGEEVGQLSSRGLLRLRRRVQMVFQDPYESLNPRMRVGDIVAEPLRVHRVASGAELRRRVEAALTAAGPDARRAPTSAASRSSCPAASASASSSPPGLALEPTLLIADEPVSMLDVSIRADILNLLGALARERGIAVVMITHDLSTVAAYADRIAVMYLGRIVEYGPTREVLANPQHPYAQALLSVVPIPDPAMRRRPVILGGETPDPVADPVRLPLPPALPGRVRPMLDGRPAALRGRRRTTRRRACSSEP